MNFWKARALTMGSILIILGSLLIATRRYSNALVVLPVIGVVLLAVGLFMK